MQGSKAQGTECLEVPEVPLPVWPREERRRDGGHSGTPGWNSPKEPAQGAVLRAVEDCEKPPSTGVSGIATGCLGQLESSNGPNTLREPPTPSGNPPCTPISSPQPHPPCSPLALTRGEGFWESLLGVRGSYFKGAW